MRLDQQQRLLRKGLRKLLPANQDDVAAVAAIAARGYPAVEPILLDLMMWTRHDHWPVAKPAREFLTSLKYHERGLADIGEVFDILKSKGLPDAVADGGLQAP